MSRKSSHKDEQKVGNAASVVLITNHFPYGLYESFLENELPALTKNFGKVIILCRDVTSAGERPLHGATAHRVNPRSSPAENITTALLCVRHAFKVWQYVRDELRWLKEHNRKLTSYILDEITHNLVKGLQTAHHIRRILDNEGITGDVVLYSYWLTSSALATTFVSSGRLRIVRLSRAHGGDVYEYRNENKYLPFRRTLVHQLNRVFAISDDAAAHLRRQTTDTDSLKIQVARLGTTTAGKSPEKGGGRLTVVSCSFLVEVKRVHVLIDALQQIDRVDIQWIHIGGGPLEEQIKTRAKERLGAKANITYQLPGSRTNDQLMQFYRENHIDVFVNTSSAEGIPVTIMEAQSFGIPVVAPRVGGIPEIVSDQTGRLFDVDASPLTIARLITEVLELSPADVKAMRQAAFQNWKTNYNADKNFSTFVAEIQKLT
ncbi:glycosyltransferase [Chryseolinea sp. T2]|uniref:glycosyltransferase n=1 Tax=Chryseolinea sp. T2 TaxID=3129255 RepID=UPI003076AA21